MGARTHAGVKKEDRGDREQNKDRIKDWGRLQEKLEERKGGIQCKHKPLKSMRLYTSTVESPISSGTIAL